MVSKQSGFTVLELVVALSVAGLVGLSVYGLYSAITDAGRTLAMTTRAADADANQERFLRSLIHHAPVATDSLPVFEGFSSHSTFGSWCPVGGGWRERCRVLLEVQEQVGVSWSVGTTAHAARMAWPHGPRHLIYLTSVRGGGRWLRRWGAGARVPYAIGIVTDLDTIVVRLGSL